MEGQAALLSVRVQSDLHVSADRIWSNFGVASLGAGCERESVTSPGRCFRQVKRIAPWRSLSVCLDCTGSCRDIIRFQMPSTLNKEQRQQWISVGLLFALASSCCYILESGNFTEPSWIWSRNTRFAVL